ncbi:MAG: hypothetical protein GF334_04020 [Candidatus Altiarchaeales archaeon]|nr:hypothetical protein [Candidatus Altiarchaeales archaeon]
MKSSQEIAARLIIACSESKRLKEACIPVLKKIAGKDYDSFRRAVERAVAQKNSRYGALEVQNAVAIARQLDLTEMEIKGLLRAYPNRVATYIYGQFMSPKLSKDLLSTLNRFRENPSDERLARKVLEGGENEGLDPQETAKMAKIYLIPFEGLKTLVKVIKEASTKNRRWEDEPDIIDVTPPRSSRPSPPPRQERQRAQRVTPSRKSLPSRIPERVPRGTTGQPGIGKPVPTRSRSRKKLSDKINRKIIISLRALKRNPQDEIAAQGLLHQALVNDLTFKEVLKVMNAFDIPKAGERTVSEANRQRAMARFRRNASSSSLIERLKRDLRHNPNDMEARKKLLSLQIRHGGPDIPFWDRLGLLMWVMGEMGKVRGFRDLEELRKKNLSLNKMDQDFLLKLSRGKGWKKNPRSVDPIDGNVVGADTISIHRYPGSRTNEIFVRISEKMQFIPPEGRNPSRWIPVSYTLNIRDVPARKTLVKKEGLMSPEAAKKLALSSLERIFQARAEKRRREEKIRLQQLQR